MTISDSSPTIHQRADGVSLQAARGGWLQSSLIGALLLIAVACAGCSQESKWTPANVALTKQRGEEIIDALERFHTTNGKYPVTLAELVPNYILSIPIAAAGSPDWDYGLVHIQNEEGYRLYFRATKNGRPFWYYGSISKAWIESDAMFD